MKSKLIIGMGISCALAVLVSCGKKSAESEPAASTEAPTEPAAASAKPVVAQEAPVAAKGIELEGEREVRQALARKDYTTAVTRLVAMRPQIPAELTEKYIAFQYEVRNTLQDASATDPKAAEAVILLGALQRGR